MIEVPVLFDVTRISLNLPYITELERNNIISVSEIMLIHQLLDCTTARMTQAQGMLFGTSGKVSFKNRQMLCIQMHDKT